MHPIQRESRATKDPALSTTPIAAPNSNRCCRCRRPISAQLSLARRAGRVCWRHLRADRKAVAAA